MENSHQQPSRAKNSAWLIVLLSVLMALVAVWFPAALLLTAALWAYVGARTNPAWIALPAAVYGILAASAYGAEAAIGLIAAVVAAAVALYYLQTKRVSNTYTVLTLAGLFLAGLYCAVCLPGILSGAGAFTAAQAYITEMISGYRAAAQQISGVSAESLALVEEYLDAFSEAAPSYIVAVLCIGGGVLGLSNLLFFRLFCRKNTEIVISPMRPFRLWTMPRSMMLGLFALLVGSLAFEWSGWAYSESMANTVNALVGMPLLVQGLCVVDFFLARTRRGGTGAKVVTYILIALLFGILEMPLILVGCFDQIFRFRERMQNMPPRQAI